MSIRHIPLDRSRFTVIRKESTHYTLHSEKYDRTLDISILIYNIDEPDSGDVFELPDCMLYMEEGLPIFSNNLLQFDLPHNGISLPEDFNIEEDYAYLTYTKTNKRIRIQRVYG